MNRIGLEGQVPWAQTVPETTTSSSASARPAITPSQRQGSPASNIGLELDVIAAVVIGGASLNADEFLAICAAAGS
jgi:ribose/xylose/arabinose/galactoside ABC-type transport system permease subunit